MAKKIAIMMYKGGSGKTTTTINLAAALASLDKRVLVVDLDRQGNATTGLGFVLGEPERTVNDLFKNQDTRPREVILKTAFNIDVMASARELARTAMNMRPGDEHVIRLVLEDIDDDYDFVLIDTPPNEGYMTYSALAAADGVIVPVATKGFAEEGLAQTAEAIQHARRTFNPTLEIFGVLLTIVEPRTSVARAIMDSVREDFPDKLFETAIVKAALFDKANETGVPAVFVDPKHPASEAYIKVARSIINGNHIG